MPMWTSALQVGYNRGVGKLVNREVMKTDVVCDFCHTEQPLANINCEKCEKRLPIPRPRFSDEITTVPAFFLAIGSTFLFLGFPTVAVYFLVGLSPIHWGFYGLYMLLGLLIEVFSDPTNEDDLQTAVDTPDFSNSMKGYNSHVDAWISARILSLPWRMTFYSWNRFFFALSGK